MRLGLGSLHNLLSNLNDSQMRDVLQTEELDIPEGVKVIIKSRIITVEGPRGVLTRDVHHINMDIRLVKGKANKVTLAVWQGGRKHVACLRTVKSLILNLIKGVTKVSSSFVLFAARTVKLGGKDALDL